MTLYLVKHDDGDVRLHDESGSELFTLPANPVGSDGPERELIEAFKSANPDADLIADPNIRPHFIDLLANNWHYRDLTADGEVVPW